MAKTPDSSDDVFGASAIRESIEGRMSATEANVRGIASSVRGLTESFDKFRVEVQHGFADIHNRISVGTRTQWPTLIGSGALILTIVGMIGAALIGWNRDTTGRHDVTLAKMAEIMFTQQYERGRQSVEVEKGVAAIAKLDVDLQREMRLLDGTTKAEISQMDSKLTKLVTDLSEHGVQRANSLSERINSVQSVTLDNSKGVAAIIEKFEAVNKDIARLEKQRDKDYQDLQALAAKMDGPVITQK